ncbi:unnamed protein product, partial [Meganyctiphanes norvegica]
MIFFHESLSQAPKKPVKLSGSYPCLILIIGTSVRPAGSVSRYSKANSSLASYSSLFELQPTQIKSVSQISSNMTSSSTKSSWLKFTTSSTLNTPEASEQWKSLALCVASSFKVLLSAYASLPPINNQNSLLSFPEVLNFNKLIKIANKFSVN